MLLVAAVTACGSKTGLRVGTSRLDASSGSGAGGGASPGRPVDGASPTDRDGAVGGDDVSDGGVPFADGSATRFDGSTGGGGGGGGYVVGPVDGVATGAEHTCVWRTTGEVQCWGNNEFGQAGAPPSTSVRTPTFVPGAVAVRMALGARHTCALDSAGSVTCWGLNTWGMLGVESPPQTDRPQRVAGLPPISRLAAGWSHTCALAVSGEVYCWGKNDAGQLGNFSTGDAHRPVRVRFLGPALDVTAGRANTCAITVDGGAYCWGANNAGELGYGGGGGSTFMPGRVPLPEAMTAVRAGDASGCALGTEGRLRCWGNAELSTYRCAPTCLPEFCDDVDSRHPLVWFSGRVDEVALGRAHFCLIDGARALHCWGGNDRRQLGFDSGVACDESRCPAGLACTVSDPVSVAGVRDLTHVALGLDHTCAVDARHFVFCWGDNRRAQAGGAGPVVPYPSLVPGL